MYSITNYFANSTTLEFTDLQTKQKFSFKISNSKENRYKQVSKKYYIEVSTGDLIIINDDTLSLENRYQNIDGNLYRRATQT
jgi:rRNA maturation protein Rpf1